MTLPSLWTPNGGKSRLVLLEVNAEGVQHVVLVESDEICQRDPDCNDEVYRAMYTLHYQPVSTRDYFPLAYPKSDTFTAGYDRFHNTVSITSHEVLGTGGVFLSPDALLGTRVGTYLMNRLVAWAKQWPGAELKTISLLEGQATPENKARRNRFYEQFSIRFEWDNPVAMTSGQSRPMTAGELTLSDAWQKTISEHNLVTYLAAFQSNRTGLQSELNRLRRENHELEVIYRRPYRHAISTLWQRGRYYLVMGGVMVSIGILWWFRRGG